ncbi:hypothetical protein [Bradyrhizobium sp. AZCC 1699]|uniref:hypothetical protein n=1 Tax=Bradyrhizobium sp. AZCC 1699 TaxID=3117024 RepID=UPI002FF00AD4
MNMLTGNSASRVHPTLKKLPKVVVAHATFQNAIAGSPSESSLAYPIQAYLGVNGWAISTEQDHPNLNVGEKLGRPSQIDFIGKRKDRQEKWSLALETKIYSRTKEDRLIRDVIKLLLLDDVDRCLLVVFPISPKEGISIENGEAKFSNGWKSFNLFDRFLPWNVDGPKKLFLGDDSLKGIRNHINAALTAFGKERVRGEFNVELCAKNWSDDFVCCLWRFLWAGKRIYSPNETNK